MDNADNTHFRCAREALRTVKHYRGPLDHGWALMVSPRIDLACRLRHALER
jgi:hypothetical protein